MSKKNSRLNYKTVYILLVIACLSIYLTGCSFHQGSKEALAAPLVPPKSMKYYTMLVERQSLVKLIGAKGQFYSIYQFPLSFKNIGGFLKWVNPRVNIRTTAKTGELLAELDSDSIRNSIKRQEINIKLAELNLEQYSKIPEISVYDIEKLKIALEIERNKLKDLNEQFVHCKIYAPITGDIITMEKLNVGDYIPPNKTLMTVSNIDSSTFLLRCKADNANEFLPGMKVQVVLRGYDEPSAPPDPENIYHKKGRVVAAPSALPSDASNDLKGVFFVQVEGLPKFITIDEIASVKAEVSRRNSVLTIFGRYVAAEKDEKYVYIFKNGIKEKRIVALGLYAGDKVEVISGLEEGDQLVIGNPYIE